MACGANGTLGLGAIAADHPLLVAVLMISSLLNIAYLLPVAIAGFWYPAEDERADGAIREAPLLCVIPLTITALGGVVLFFLADRIYNVLVPLGSL